MNQQQLTETLYHLRKDDPYKELLEPASFNLVMDSVMEDGGEPVVLDALMVEARNIERKAKQIGLALNMKGDTLKVAEKGVTVSEPYRSKGTTVMVIMYELTDGQTISIFFHNPDANPKKIAPDDELISWKWLLNRKDITIVVAKESGADLPPTVVAQRVMGLAEKNKARFAKANGKRSERESLIAQLEREVEEKTIILNNNIETIKQLTSKRQNEDKTATTKFRSSAAARRYMSTLGVVQWLPQDQYESLQNDLVSDNDWDSAADGLAVFADAVGHLPIVSDIAAAQGNSAYIHFKRGTEDLFVVGISIDRMTAYVRSGESGTVKAMPMKELTMDGKVDLMFDYEQAKAPEPAPEVQVPEPATTIAPIVVANTVAAQTSPEKTRFEKVSDSLSKLGWDASPLGGNVTKDGAEVSYEGISIGDKEAILKYVIKMPASVVYVDEKSKASPDKMAELINKAYESSKGESDNNISSLLENIANNEGRKSDGWDTSVSDNEVVISRSEIDDDGDKIADAFLAVYVDNRKIKYRGSFEERGAESEIEFTSTDEFYSYADKLFERAYEASKTEEPTTIEAPIEPIAPTTTAEPIIIHPTTTIAPETTIAPVTTQEPAEVILMPDKLKYKEVFEKIMNGEIDLTTPGISPVIENAVVDAIAAGDKDLVEAALNVLAGGTLDTIEKAA